MIWKEGRTGDKGDQSGEDDCQQQFAVNNTLAAPFKSLVHFCKCGRHDLIACVGWCCTTILTFALRRQQGEADHTSVTTRDQTRFRAPPREYWCDDEWFPRSRREKRLQPRRRCYWCSSHGVQWVVQLWLRQRLQPLPGSFSRASSCYIFITIMVQVASRRWPYPQHLRNRRRCVEVRRSSTPDVPAVPLWNSMDTISFIFKQWWLSIQVWTTRSY